ncbi:hypothetical protein B0T17DRAFT_623351 [Bombardia bombarda]|uniref:Uncharacterized protein n=1 Tax=Bombardia bombarda TaxID=252184 RepID=A0AA40CF28_9PEZI|nr:hypothetical protein B0T17DRAFT_623351 [Bombardia bombarda]
MASGVISGYDRLVFKPAQSTVIAYVTATESVPDGHARQGGLASSRLPFRRGWERHCQLSFHPITSEAFCGEMDRPRDRTSSIAAQVRGAGGCEARRARQAGPCPEDMAISQDKDTQQKDSFVFSLLAYPFLLDVGALFLQKRPWFVCADTGKNRNVPWRSYLRVFQVVAGVPLVWSWLAKLADSSWVSSLVGPGCISPDSRAKERVRSGGGTGSRPVDKPDDSVRYCQGLSQGCSCRACPGALLPLQTTGPGGLLVCAVVLARRDCCPTRQTRASDSHSLGPNTGWDPSLVLTLVRAAVPGGCTWRVRGA